MLPEIALSVAILAIASTALLAFLGAPATALKALTRTETLAAGVRSVERSLDEIRTADLPSVRRACEVMLEDAEAMLASAETKRKRAAASASRSKPEESAPVGLDAVGMDPAAQRAALTEHFRGH